MVHLTFNDIILEENDVVITEKSAVAELFNYHFIQAANSVARIDDSDYGQDFENHPSIIMNILETSTRHFPLIFTIPIMCRLKNCLKMFSSASKSSGHDMLPPRLIKASAAAIAELVANIFNASIAQGCYPSAWKMAQVTPLFKKNNEFKKEN